jgi:PAS domain S-box-containing protein
MGDGILRALVEVVPAPLLVVDGSRRFLYVNPAACELFGRRRQDLLGMDLADCIVARERAEVVHYLGSVLPHEPARRSMRVLRPDDVERDVVFSHTIFEFGTELLLAGVLEDVTETRRVRREAIALAEAAASLAVTRSLEAALDALAQSVVETTSAVACGVFLLDEREGLRTAGTFGLPEGYAAAMDAAAKQGAPGRRSGPSRLEPPSSTRMPARGGWPTHVLPRSMVCCATNPGATSWRCR